ncbi:hypothetical protein BH09PLA1_BH09PLA1_14200 [soil metagenome]
MSVVSTEQAAQQLDARRAEVDWPPPEPFGQQGIGRFILPVLAAISMVVVGVSGTLWYRSFTDMETMARVSGNSTYVVRSVVGRLFVYRVDFDGAVPYSINDSSGWNYSTVPLSQPLPDGWKESWKKKIGIEWDSSPPSPLQGVTGGYWLRVQWRTIFVAACILPIVRLIVHYRRRAIERQRGFAVGAS